MLCSESLRSCQWVNFSHSCSHPGGVNKHVTNHHHILIKMLGYQNGNLSDSSSDTSAASHRTNNHEGCLVNADLNDLNLSINSDQGQDSQTLEILRLRAENAELKRRLREAQSSDEESDDADGKKSWSELGKKRKKQLVRNISKEMEKIAEERRTGVGNIAANILARL